jgi:D-alanyl-D-alanine carboxypeptidase/D-alanyl-D-alanine-endopeptidase (penicillin-binding protein 4)
MVQWNLFPGKSRKTKRHLGEAIWSLAFLLVIAQQPACSRSGSEHALSDPELIENSEIYLGDSLYKITASDAENESERTSDSDRIHSLEAPSKSDPRPAPPPVDVDYILTKSKDIEVGVSTDIPNSRTQNEAKLFVPASITKVFTTAVALKSLGPHFRFKSTLSFSQEGFVARDLVIESDGDPTVGIEALTAGAPKRMSEMASALAEKGVREIRGAITLLSSFPQLDAVRYAAGIPESDMRECYGSLASSFNFNGNCAAVRIHPKTGFRWQSLGIEERIIGELSTSTGDRNSLAIDVLLSPMRALQGFRLRGIYNSQGPRVIQWKLPIGNAAGWYGQELLNALRSRQIKINGEISVALTGSVPSSISTQRDERARTLKLVSQPGRTQLIFWSSELTSLVEATNKPSDNFLADSLFKAAGVRNSSGVLPMADNAGDALELGQKKLAGEINDWLRKSGQSKIAEELTFFDGAGLSLDSRVSPRAFMAILRLLPEESFFPALWNSLPTAGEEGTLSGRMGNTLVAGRVRAKTGTLTGSYQLAGYIPKQVGARIEFIPFVILTATSARNRDKARRFQDALVVKMAEIIGRRDITNR